MRDVNMIINKKVLSINKRNLNNFSKNYLLYLMLIPAVLMYIIFKYIPMYGILIAFEDYNIFQGVFKSTWVGLDVFKDVISQKTFWQVFINTLRLNLLTLIIGFPVPIIFALLLNEITRSKFKKVIQTISYLPHFMSWIIVYGMLLAFVSMDTGLINIILSNLGIPQVGFLLDHKWWYVFYIGAGIWKEMGWGAIMYIAALSSINPEIYEAAEIDGAGRFRRIWHVTLPGIKSTIVILLIFNIGSMMSIGFDQPFLMGNAMVNDISDVLSTYIYRNGLIQAQFSFTTAIGLFQSVINFILLLLADYAAKKLGEEGLFGGKKK